MNRPPTSTDVPLGDSAAAAEPLSALDPSPADFPLGDTTLVLPDHVRARLDAWVRAGHPEETCGLLVGRRAGARLFVVRALQARNLEREHRRDRFDLDPVAYVAADRAARAEGLEVLGVWHSHPDQPATPSEADLREAWADHSYLIAAVDEHGVRELVSYRLDGARFVREHLAR